MRRLAALLMTAPVLAMSTGLAAQQTVVTQTLGVNGSTPQVCSVGSGRFRTGELVNFRGSDGDTLAVLELVDPQTLAAQSARATVILDGVCNFPHRVRFESQDNGLWPISGPVAPISPDFATALPYRASFTWADRTGEIEADAKVRRPRLTWAEVDEPASGELLIDIELDAGASNTQIGAPVLAGAYSDTLRIYLEPR